MKVLQNKRPVRFA